MQKTYSANEIDVQQHKNVSAHPRTAKLRTSFRMRKKKKQNDRYLIQAKLGQLDNIEVPALKIVSGRSGC